MLFIRLMLTLALPLLTGFCCVSLIYKNKISLSWLERFGLAWGSGVGLLGLSMFAVSTFGFPVNLQTSMLPAVIFIFCSLPCLISKKHLIFDLASFRKLCKTFFKIKEKNNWGLAAEKALILLIGLTLVHVFFCALVKPIVDFDDLWRQGCIAKIIFATGKVLTAQSMALAESHPFLNPLSQAWIYLGIGTWNDAIGKIVFAFYYMSLLFLLYANLRRKFSRIFSLVFTYLFTSFPLIVYHAGTAYSDLMQTFYYSAGVLYLFRWMEDQESGSLYFSAVLLGIGNFVKQTGIPLWGMTLLVLLVYVFFEGKVKLKKLAVAGAIFFLLSALVSSPWLFYKNSFLMSKAMNLAGTVVSSAQTSVPHQTYPSPSLLDILSHMGRRMFAYADWQILWFAFILVSIFCFNLIFKSKLKYLFLIIILNLSMLVYAFSDGKVFLWLQDGTLIQRVMMYPIPVVLFFVTNCMGRCLYEK